VSEVATPRRYYRWVICSLLFAATAINYIDRQTISVLKPHLQGAFTWSEIDYGDIVFYFQAAYAVSYLVFGRLVDKIGAKAGYAVAMTLWTAAHMAHALATSLGGFMLARAALGIGEAGNFPAGLKVVAEWFPKSERAFAVGVFNAGANVGAIITPLLVPVITLTYGWPAAFIATGMFSVVWLAVWLWIYRRPEQESKLSAEELAFIKSDPPDPPTPVSWRKLLTKKQAWAYAAGKFLIDPIWWMFLFWLPDFFAKRHNLDLQSFGPPLAIVYILSDLGSVAGGWLSSTMIKHGSSVNRARKLAMLISALAVLPVVGAEYIDNLWMAVGIVGLATAAHQSFSCNLYTLPSDLFPRGAVGSVSGLGGTAGAIGGMLMAKYAGWILDSIGSYTPIFMIAAFTYLGALLVVHILSPNYEPATLD
jgi:ACS family hexuronate transporter-like MFS transporter